MNKNWKDITYLKRGNLRQKKVFRILSEIKLMKVLAPFDPILVGTIPLGIDIDTSDLDIICEVDSFIKFRKLVTHHYGHESVFSVTSKKIRSLKTMIIRFKYEQEQIEIFGQKNPTENQYAFRHMVIENKILKQKGIDFHNKILRLKKGGIKTEPAFAKCLGLSGDPYERLLNYEIQH